MASPLNTQKIPPVPSAQDIVEREQKVITQPWQQWFQQIRDKVNVITASIVALAGNATAGFLSSDGLGGITTRTLIPGTNVTITNGDGVLGNPVISATGGGGGGIASINTQIGSSYTIAASDVNVLINMTNGTSTLLKIPTNISVPITSPAVIYYGSDVTKLSIQAIDSTVTTVYDATSAGNLGNTTSGALIKIGTDVWYITGTASYIYTYNALVLQDSPVGFWPLSETSGTVATDLSGHSNNGTYIGGYTQGFAGIPSGGTGVLLNGSSGYIVCPLVTSQVLNVTLEAWVNFNTASALHGPFIEIGSSSNGYSMGCGSTTYDTAGNNFISLQEAIAWHTPSPAIPIASTGWYHCVMTLDGTGNASYYLNGSFVGTTANGIANTPTLNTYLGTDYLNNTIRYFGGALCNCAIYNTALSATRILAHYNAGVA